MYAPPAPPRHIGMRSCGVSRSCAPRRACPHGNFKRLVKGTGGGLGGGVGAPPGLHVSPACQRSTRQEGRGTYRTHKRTTIGGQ